MVVVSDGWAQQLGTRGRYEVGQFWGESAIEEMCGACEGWVKTEVKEEVVRDAGLSMKVGEWIAVSRWIKRNL